MVTEEDEEAHIHGPDTFCSLDALLFFFGTNGAFLLLLHSSREVLGRSTGMVLQDFGLPQIRRARVASRLLCDCPALLR